MSKVKMDFYPWNYCGGYEYWLTFKQGDFECSIGKKPSSTKVRILQLSQYYLHGFFEVNHQQILYEYISHAEEISGNNVVLPRISGLNNSREAVRPRGCYLT